MIGKARDRTRKGTKKGRKAGEVRMHEETERCKREEGEGGEKG